MLQRRKFPRVNKHYRISYTLVNQEQFATSPLQSLAVNISGGGMCFAADDALATNTLLALEIKADNFSSTILALARVAWCKPKGDRFEVGAEFWWIGWRDHEAQALMANFIATTTTPQSASS
jgi:hypothetical protein